MKPTPKELQAIHEKYELVIKHLVDEQDVEDKENADEIVRGMSEQWFEQIIKG